MKMALTACVCALIGFANISPASAAGITPPGAPFTLFGQGSVVQGGNNGYICQMTVFGITGPSVGGNPPRASGGNISGAVASSPFGNCDQVSLDPTTFRITGTTPSGGRGVFEGMTFRVGGSTFCSTSADVEFELFNNNTGRSRMQVFTEPLGGNCTFTATFDTIPDLDIVP